MPNSLKCRLKKLAYQGLLSEKDLSRIYTDNDVIMEFEKIKAEIEQDAFKDVNGSKYIFVNRVNQIIDKYKVELKGENK